MDDLAALFRRSVSRFGELIAAVRPDQWSAPTPCEDWDVRALVNHVAAEQLWAPHLMAGETIADVGDRYDGDVLGDDPLAMWEPAAAGAVAAFSTPGAPDTTVHLSYADEVGREYMTQMLTDAAVHGWDLARAVGVDERIDPDAVAVLLPHWRRHEELLRGSGMFGGHVEIPDDADDQTRLLALLGRRP